MSADADKTIRVLRAEFKEKFGHEVDTHGLTQAIQGCMNEQEAEFVQGRLKNINYVRLAELRVISTQLYKTETLKQLDEMVLNKYFNHATKLMQQMFQDQLISKEELFEINKAIEAADAAEKQARKDKELALVSKTQKKTNHLKAVATPIKETQTMPAADAATPLKITPRAPILAKPRGRPVGWRKSPPSK